MTAVAGGIALVLAATASYLSVRRGIARAKIVLRVAAALAIGFDALYLGQAIQREGFVATLQHSYADTLLLAILITIMGVGTHLSRRLRGIDGFLFLMALLPQLGALTIMSKADVAYTDRVWFASHSLAFALSGTLFVAGGVAGFAYLLVNRMLRQKSGLGLVGNVASLESLERFGRWMPILGFPLFTYGILTGLCGVWHRPELARSAWYVDPALLFSVITWAVYAYLCYGSMYRSQVRGRQAAVLSTYGMGLVVAVFLFRELFSTMHQ